MTRTESILAPSFVPLGWPVIEPELLMGYVGSVMVVRMGGALSASGFARYLEEWVRAIDARPATARVFSMYDLPDWFGMTATQRAQWGATLKSREETLRRTTCGMVLASPSTLTRGGVSTIFGIAPPPYPHAVVETPKSAFTDIALRGGPPADAAFEAYEAFVARLWRAAE
jgi:hypothetical protein